MKETDPRNSRIRILFLSQRFLLPMDTGGKIRTGKMLEYLNKLCDVTLLSNIDPKRDRLYLERMERLCSHFIGVPKTERRRYSPGYYVDILCKSLSPYPISALNDFDDGLVRSIHGSLRENPFDLLVCDFVQSALNLRRVGACPSLLLQHNAESLLALRHFENARGFVAKTLWRTQWEKMRQFEKRACSQFDCVVSISPEDSSYLKDQLGAENVCEIPTGVDTRYFVPGESDPEPRHLVFVGSLDWLPNEDAVQYFVDDIFWRILKQIPGVTMSVVGRNPSDRLRRSLRRLPQIELTGWVPDTRPHVRRSEVFVVPLRIGGGTRIKIYEAMAMGMPVVSTSLGAEGLNVVPGDNILLADGAESFAARVVSLLEDRDMRTRLGKRAREAVENGFGWEEVAEKFHDICIKVARGG